MTTTEIEDMKDGDTMPLEGGALTCRDDYRHWYTWSGGDDAGYPVEIDIVQARSGKWGIGRWDNFNERYHLPAQLPGFTAYVTRDRGNVPATFRSPAALIKNELKRVNRNRYA